MAPEQCDPDRRGEVGFASDVWGLGATLHHAVAGSVPFPRPEEARESDDPSVRFPQLVEQPVPLPGGTPERLHALIASMLEPEPASRPTAGEVAGRLEPLVAERPHKMVLSRRGARLR
jgi:serine/threonine protein kinase